MLKRPYICTVQSRLQFVCLGVGQLGPAHYGMANSVRSDFSRFQIQWSFLPKSTS
jgi:hypothetical protein